MDQVSRPLLIALAAAAAFLVLWMVALRPHGSSTSGPAPAKPLASAQPAPKPAAPRPVPRAVPRRGPAHRAKVAPALLHPASPARPAAVSSPATPATRLGAVQRAIASGHVLALLFYNPAAADDQAVKQELASVPVHGGNVFKLEIPLSEGSSYAALTNQVPVNISPTLVIIDRQRHAQEITGFADSFEIAQRLSDALSTRPAAS
jgi:hypothetical protein